MKNKVFSLGMIFLFVFSLVSVAIAQENTTETTTETSEEATAISTATSEQTAAGVNIVPIRERFRAGVANYIEARQAYLNVRQNFLDQRRVFINSKEKLVNCRADFSDRCKMVRAEIKTNAKPFLLNSADLVLKLLDNLGTRISNSNMSDEEKNGLLADLDARIQGVEDAKTKIDGLTQNSTNEETKEAAKVIRTAWLDTRKDIKRVTGHLINFRVGEIIVRAERLEERLDKVVEKAKANGKDTTQLESLINNFKEKVNEAREKYELAKAKYTEAKTAGDVDSVIKEANQYLKEAHSKLKEAHSILKDIVSEIRKRGQEKTLEETSVEATETSGENTA